MYILKLLFFLTSENSRDYTLFQKFSRHPSSKWHEKIDDIKWSIILFKNHLNHEKHYFCNRTTERTESDEASCLLETHLIDARNSVATVEIRPNQLFRVPIIISQVPCIGYSDCL